jgi:hypothetical protein
MKLIPIFSFLLYLQKMNSNNIIEFLVIDGGSDDGNSKNYFRFF